VDNSTEEPIDRRTVCRFGPDRRLTALTAAMTLVAVGLVVVTSDRPGQVLFGCAAAVLGLYTAGDLAFWPRLRASAEGLVVRAPTGSAQLSWSQVRRVTADSRQRYGLRSVTLEIDADEHLFVFSRRALGADPEHVAAVLAAVAPPPG
jgi:hypothetical protein